jgi:penicillin-binding protein 1B
LPTKFNESGYRGRRQDEPLRLVSFARPDGIEIFPGKQSETESEPAVLRIQDKQDSLDHRFERQFVTPRVFARAGGAQRDVRRRTGPSAGSSSTTTFRQVLVDAVVSIEDKRFFSHSGFDPIRFTKAVWVDSPPRERAV